MNFTPTINFDALLKYIQNKEKDRGRIEEIVLKAIKDDDFIKHFIDLSFLSLSPQMNQIISNPTLADRLDDYTRRYYEALNYIASSYTTYLYDKKGKYSNLKNEIEEVERRILEADENIEKIIKTSHLLEGAELLESYAKEFKERSEEYDIEANKWQKLLMFSFLGFSITFILLLFINVINLTWLKKYIAEDLLFYGYISAIIIKAVIIISLIQVIRFCFRNYNANKHLSQQSLHKYDVLRSLRGVYNTIDGENKEARDELIKTGAVVAFQNVESGYITTKEGAGSTDSGLTALIASILKK